MGQGQSQSDRNVASNHAPRASSTNSSKNKKSKRKGSSKSSSQGSDPSPSLARSPSDSPGSRKAGQTAVQSRGMATSSPPKTANGTTGPSTQTPSLPVSSTSTTGNSNVPHRGSFSNGERSVPARQFSLTRQTPAQTTQNKHAQIEKYFNKYKDKEEDAILAEGMEKFCVDLGVDPTEFIVLVLAWRFEASQMCRFTREEFINGCQKMQAHNAKSLKDRFPELLSEAKSKKNFKELYNFTFSFGLDHSTGQRSLPIDMAKPLWDLVFTQNRPELLDRWFEFLQDSEVRGISRDTWNMFLPFVESTLPDLSNYDESEAWPSLFDDFVEGELERTTL